MDDDKKLPPPDIEGDGHPAPPADDAADPSLEPVDPDTLDGGI